MANNFGVFLMNVECTDPNGEEMQALTRAIKLFCDAIKIRMEAGNEISAARSQENMAEAYLALSECDTDNRQTHIRLASDSIEEAIRVFSKGDMPYDLSTASKIRERITQSMKF